MKNNSRLIIVSIIAVAFLAFLAIIAMTGSRTYFNAKVQINTIPDDSTITIDNKKVSQGKQISVGAGEHTIKVSREGFNSNTQKVTVKNREKKVLSIYLDPNSSVGIEWLSLHPFQSYALEGVGSRGFDKAVAESEKRFPIIDQLPLFGPDYNINYGQSVAHPNDPSALAIIIQASTPFARQQALDQIREAGFDPTDMEIEFTTP